MHWLYFAFHRRPLVHTSSQIDKKSLQGCGNTRTVLTRGIVRQYGPTCQLQHGGLPFF